MFRIKQQEKSAALFYGTQTKHNINCFMYQTHLMQLLHCSVTLMHLMQLPPGFEIWTNAPAGHYHSSRMGRFELIVGEERDGCPVFKQGHSTASMPRQNEETLLYRWEILNNQ